MWRKSEWKGLFFGANDGYFQKYNVASLCTANAADFESYVVVFEVTTLRVSATAVWWAQLQNCYCIFHRKY